MSKQEQPSFSPADFGRFLLEYALYQKLYADFPLLKLPQSLEELLPAHIYHYCDSSPCKREQAFRDYLSQFAEKDKATLTREAEENAKQLSARSLSGPGLNSAVGKGLLGLIYRTHPYGVYLIRYLCSVCGITQLFWWVQIGIDRKGKIYVQKVGQLPPYDIAVPRDVGKKLNEEDLKLYKEAQVCISQNYGIGACIYLRRLIENQIDMLLEILLETKQNEANEVEIQKVKAIIAEPILENKIKLVTQTDQASGFNVVGRMYDRLSDAIHNRSDDDCTTIAKGVLELFNEVLIELKKRQESQRDYLEKLKVLEVPARPREAMGQEARKDDSSK